METTEACHILAQTCLLSHYNAYHRYRFQSISALGASQCSIGSQPTSAQIAFLGGGGDEISAYGTCPAYFMEGGCHCEHSDIAYLLEGWLYISILSKSRG